MKHITALLCILLLCVTLGGCRAGTMGEVETVHAVLTVNETLMAEAFREPHEVEPEHRQIEITLDTKAATATLNGEPDVILPGRVEKYICSDRSIGYVGVYEGELADGKHVIADVTYNAEDVFVTLSVKTKDSLEFIIYGEITKSIQKISDQRTKEVEKVHGPLE